MSDEKTTTAIAFSTDTLAEFEDIVSRYPNKEAAMLPALHLAKREFKVISPEVMAYVARLLDLSPLDVLNVVSFYTLYPREEEGRHVIQVCATLSCDLMGATSIVDHLKEKLNIEVGQTTPDKRFTLKKVECLGSCGTAPMFQINDDYYENLTIERVDQILDSLK